MTTAGQRAGRRLTAFSGRINFLFSYMNPMSGFASPNYGHVDFLPAYFYFDVDDNFKE